jgi:phospholipid/cholesterol/gamma-HCH transport system ATP-binding protein
LQGRREGLCDNPARFRHAGIADRYSSADRSRTGFNQPVPMPAPVAAQPPVTAEALITVDRVTFGYDASRTILQDVSLSFARGRITAIMGGSGCGKTTLLRLIGGVHAPSKGTVSFDGEVIDTRNREQLYRLRRRLGMLFQFGALFTDLTVFENVAFPLREHTRLPESMIRDIVLLKLNAVGLRGAAQLRISEVSGGMARRIALARAIALDPELIMYDEPFAGLDPISMGVAANLIRRLNDATGATSLIVSHDVQECFLISDYAYLISSGRIVGHGTPAELKASDDPEVRQFIRGEPDGPVPFHYPAPPVAEGFGFRA